ncbi:MAG: class I SAM-dependent methyltransferase [Gemmatimonadota bacterium]
MRARPDEPITEDYLATNRELWDAWTAIHESSDFYDVDTFRAGGNTLHSIELELVGDVAGKDLLHLQCHFGLDTLSWARRGARVTGVDFSEPAIALARELAENQGLAAEFVCREVTSLPEEWTDRFDVVFTSYGVLPWLPDLGAWARTIARVLAPNGRFFLVEFHPFATMLDEEGRIRHPYFRSDVPDRYELQGSYADREAPVEHEAFEWAFSLSDVHTALVGAGLTIRRMREYPFSPFGCYDFLEQTGPDRWEVRGSEVDEPLVFALEAAPDRVAR